MASRRCIRNAGPGEKLGCIECDAAGLEIGGVTGLTGESDHQSGLIERRAAAIDQRAERALLLAVHPGDVDVVADEFIDQVDVVIEPARQLHYFIGWRVAADAAARSHRARVP